MALSASSVGSTVQSPHTLKSKSRLQGVGQSLIQDVSFLGTQSTLIDASSVESYMSRVTGEDKRLAMLGHKDLNKVCGTDGIFYYREEFCGACGIIHSNPDVLDTYLNCERCFGVIREPAILRKRYSHDKQRVPLEVLFATYGDPFIPASARDVTEVLQGRVNAHAAVCSAWGTGRIRRYYWPSRACQTRYGPLLPVH
ncbi:hypothetical protein EON65_55850 [archaeon]|nr:MAG: hypothetical protein EON65_55850 [archaeon]